VLNDIGGVIAREGLARIATYAGGNPVWSDKEKAIAALLPGSMPFGPMTDGRPARQAVLVMF